jgi:signal peptidase I
MRVPLENPNRVTVRQTVSEIAQTVILAATVFLGISMFTARFEIRQVSMQPSFYSGQRIVVDRLPNDLSPWLAEIAYAASGHEPATLGLKRGQVIVFYRPGQSDVPLIKRVIGIPGDTIQIANGAVWLNGKRLDEPYTYDKPTTCSAYCGPVTLGPGMYYVMGDNRPDSLDSRIFGPISGNLIIGRVVLRYWPLNAIEYYP